MDRNLVLRWDKELAVSLMFFGPQVNYYVSWFLGSRGLPSISTFVFAVLYLIGIISYKFTISNRRSFFVTCFALLSIVFSYLSNSSVKQFMFEGSLFLSSVLVFILIYLPVFLMLLGKLNISRMLSMFEKFSILTLILAISTFSINFFMFRTRPIDYLSFAYMMITPIMICFSMGVTGKKLSLIFSIIASIVLVVVGSRGAIVALAVFLILYIFGFSTKGKSNYRRFSKWVLIFLLILFCVFYENILNGISSALGMFGYNSRTIGYLLIGNGAFERIGGRGDIWNHAIQAIGFIGKGVLGDRTVLRNEVGSPTYAHNFILEFLIDYGWIFGLTIVVFIIHTVVKAFIISKRSENDTLKTLAYSMISIIFVKHMVSSSFFISFDFWLYVGLAVHIIIFRDELNIGDNADERRQLTYE